MNTILVILKSGDANEVARFKETVVKLSQNIIEKHPWIFSGPRRGACSCSARGRVFVFQYAQFFAEHKPVSKWDTSDPPNSPEAFLLQVFLTLLYALRVKLLPARLTEWGHVAMAGGAAVIDVVSYLIKNFNEPVDSLFGEECEGMVSLCSTLAKEHVPGSDLCAWLSDLSPDTGARHVLTKSIMWLRKCEPGEKIQPRPLTLSENCFTFKDYFSDSPNWLNWDGEEEDARLKTCAKTLAYGEPPALPREQTRHSLSEMVRNIVLRMKVKIFGASGLKVTALDCARGLLKITVHTHALAEIPSVDSLQRSTFQEDEMCNFAHDAVFSTECEKAPVLMFHKCENKGPLEEFNEVYYKLAIVLVQISSQTGVRSLQELFCNIDMMGSSF